MDTAAFGARMRDLLTGHALTTLIGIGHRTGLFDAAAAQGPATSSELADRAGLDERYVREWLGAMTTGGLFELADDGRFVLPESHAVFLAGARASNIGPSAGLLQRLDAVSPQVERCLVDGGGVPYAAYAALGPMGEHWRHIYDDHLVSGFLGAVDGLDARLRAGARVLDLGCGSGHAANLMGREYPRSEITGLDLAPEAIAQAEAERAAMGLSNVAFVVADAADLAPEPAHDVITAFDAVHDQQDPAGVLRRIRAALAPGGVFVMVDVNSTGSIADDLGDPNAAVLYAISLLFCVPTSLAAGGTGLGAMWGREAALAMLADAGFDDVEVLPAPRPQNVVYVGRI
ncbi:class I SAM-dependent methyltransferase [Pseudonocardia abyssalis]|uniref:Methyltransferase domain-containing protein n=1 Tax=Pseudonocardia abyssalis TaxID=2792008 RepID=A0ABS6UPB9_9PSEU|nr:class I SAM-dependent methyltransferase [Pseudonocardia abyssalis]MBW0116814.1 methyltransferase domain-containing protein [Pseudonocardia abyssalis]MBW0134094.1 methyltransferase domain-containing protein [Pseudonocardia abyssalis]